MSDAATSPISVTTDARSLLGALSATFTRSTTVLAELLQNARRAGATSVGFQVTPTMICFVDDGCGVEDFSKLLALAQSGWSEELVREEGCYGVGWFSTLFACDQVVVRSRGYEIRANTADVLNLQPVTPTCCPDDGLTHVELHGHRLGNADGLEKEMHQLVEGFPIEVVINGKSAPRPHALCGQRFTRTEVGWVENGYLADGWVSRFYLQGLPLTHLGDKGDAFSTRYRTGGHVVHLDSTAFRGRMPDRDTLLEPEAAAANIKAALDKASEEFLVRQAEQLGPKEFVVRHFWRAMQLGLDELLNAQPCIPATSIGRFAAEPTHERDSDRFECVSSDGVVWRKDIEAGLVIDANADWESLWASSATFHCGGYVLLNRLPPGHWAVRLIKPLSAQDITLKLGSEIGQEGMDICGTGVTVKVVESIEFCAAEGEVLWLPSGLRPASAFDHEAGVLWVVPEADCSTAVFQVADFDNDDRVDTAAAYAAADRLLSVIRVLVNKDRASLVRDIFNSALDSGLPNVLTGRQFTLRIDERGQVTVAELGLESAAA